jgi:hypothetical protein
VVRIGGLQCRTQLKTSKLMVRREMTLEVDSGLFRHDLPLVLSLVEAKKCPLVAGIETANFLKIT